MKVKYLLSGLVEVQQTSSHFNSKLRALWGDNVIESIVQITYFHSLSPAFQSPLTITMPSPEPLTAAMFLFLHNMKEPGKGALNPKMLFNQLCQK